MRVLMLTHNPVGRGADFWRAYYLARQLGRRGHSVTLTGSAPIDRLHSTLQTAGVVITAIPERSPGTVGRAGYSPLALFQRVIRLRHQKFDVIHNFGHRPTVSLVARWLKRRSGCLQVADWSDRWGWGGIANERRLYGQLTLGLLDHWLERQNILGADGLTAVSTELADLALLWGKPPGDVFRLGVGAAVDVIRPQDKLQARDQLNIEPDRHVALYSGLSAFDRGHAWEVIQQILRLDASTVILELGVGPRFKRKVIEAQAEARVARLGYLSQTELGIALGGADLVLLPLADRGFNRVRLPNRVGDAAAAGRAIATNPTGQVGRLVQEHGVGIAVDEDPSSMAAAVVQLLGDRPSLQRMGLRARQLAEAKWSWAVLAQGVEAFYQRLNSSS